MLELKDYDHPYYASDSNYYSNEASAVWETASDFLDEFDDADVDMNQVFRFDIEPKDGVENQWRALVVIIGQRKGLYIPQTIKSISADELVRFESYLAKHWENMQKLWTPFAKRNEETT